MPKLIDNDGIRITDDIKELINSVLNSSHFKSEAALKMGLQPATLYFILKQGKMITWDIWQSMRDSFVSMGMIKKDDVRYMLPSEMRKALTDGFNSATATADHRSAASVNGDAIVESVNGDWKHGLTQALLDADIPAEHLVSVLRIVRDFNSEGKRQSD